MLVVQLNYFLNASILGALTVTVIPELALVLVCYLVLVVFVLQFSYMTTHVYFYQLITKD